MENLFKVKATWLWAILAVGIIGQLLRWKGIEATLKIAEFNNAKFIIVGSAKNGLPIIMDTK